MRILIADDEPEIRHILEDILASKGHEVVACKNGLEAYQQYVKADREDRRFDAVVTDYQMPQKNGVALIMDIRAINPAQKCILVSGDPPTLTEEIRKDTGDFPMLQKPFRPSDLVALL